MAKTCTICSYLCLYLYYYVGTKVQQVRDGISHICCLSHTCIDPTAGFETTAHSITFLLFELAHHPEKQVGPFVVHCPQCHFRFLVSSAYGLLPEPPPCDAHSTAGCPHSCVVALFIAGCVWHCRLLWQQSCMRLACWQHLTTPSPATLRLQNWPSSLT